MSHPREPVATEHTATDPVATDDGRIVDLLVVGAGPTGLTAAVEAIRHGLTVRIIDRKAGRSGFSKALVAHARTMEVFATMGIAERVLEHGTRFAALHVGAGPARRSTRIDLLDQPWGDTDYPFWLSIPQYDTERLLEERLVELGGRVEWGAALETLEQLPDRVVATVGDAEGRSTRIAARWLLGSDGGRSRVREQAGLRLGRTDAGATFVLADVRSTADLVEDEGRAFLSPEGVLVIVPMPEPRLWRIIAHVRRRDRHAAAPCIDEHLLDDLVRRRAGFEFGSHDIGWTSTFDLSHGVADSYRRGRVFLAGDAAHVHSPVGGQGLNTGVQDAHNLVWKLALAARIEADDADALLDSYQAERRTVAAAMVAGVARATGAITASGGFRRRILGAVAPRVMARLPVQARLARGVGMLETAYTSGALVGKGSGVVGRRLANPALRDGGRLHDRLDPLRYTWVVRGLPGPDLPDPTDPLGNGLPVVRVAEDDLLEPVSASALPPVVLVRPDRHVAMASGDAAQAVREVARRTAFGIRPQGSTGATAADMPQP